MSIRRYSLLAALALVIIFAAGNVIANSWFRSWRLDLTENHLYTLSPGTQATLNGLAEPVEMRFYYSRNAAAAFPQVQEYASRVREMLQTFAARSRGHVRFVEVNVEPFTEAEDDAMQNGIEALRPYQGADPIYFGLTGSNAIDDRRVIPSFDPQREPFLEYELTRLLFELERPQRTRVALITSLPLDPAAAADPTFPSGQTKFSAELGRLMDVVKLPPNFSEIPDADVLAIIHPWALTPTQAYAVDQFVMRKGRAFIALDPASVTAQQIGAGGDPFGGSPTASALEPMLSRWGVTMAPSVVLDAEGALPVQVQDENGQEGQAPQPLFIHIPPESLDASDLMTAQLRRGLNVGLIGGLTWTDRPGVEITKLAQTSGQTMRIPAQAALAHPTPMDIARMWQPSGGRRETLAIHLSGPLESAFPEGPPPVEAAAIDSAPATAAAPAHNAAPLARSQTPAQLVVVADTDFLADEFYVDQGGEPAVDNAVFALNAIDVLGGSDELVSLRSRAPSARPMKRLEDMERNAQTRIDSEVERLRQDMAEAQGRLEQLRRRATGSGYFTGNLGAELTPEENAELVRAQARVSEARTALRGVEHNLRADIDRLKVAIVFVNVWLAPLLIAGLGIFFFWRRQRRGGARR